MAFFTKMSLGKDSFFDGEENTPLVEDDAGLMDMEEPTPPPARQVSSDEELSVDVYNTPTHIVIVGKVAGVSDDQISVSVKEDVLTISATPTFPEDPDLRPEHLHTGELAWTMMSRPIILPKTANVKQIKARITKERVLIVKVPKIAQENEHVIRVELD